MLNYSHKTWEDLLSILGEMQGVFREFLSLLCEEERLLLGMDRQGVADITDKKDHALQTMCRYEQQVMSMLHDLAGHENHHALGKWLKQVRRPHAFKANTHLHELFGLAQKIQAQGKKNEALVRRTQHIVREAINLIYTGLGTGPVYQGSGALQFSTVPSSVNLRG